MDTLTIIEYSDNEQRIYDVLRDSLKNVEAETGASDLEAVRAIMALAVMKGKRLPDHGNDTWDKLTSQLGDIAGDMIGMVE